MSGGLDARPKVTAFEVDHLVELAWKGQIRVPHFQRDFRWGAEDVRRLFDSILKGYPVGSLLFWVRPAPARRLRLGALQIDAPQMDRAFWAVDGQQRIVSLANALHAEGRKDARFALSYDLGRRDFVPSPDREEPLVIPLPRLFELRGILEWISDYPEAEDHIDHAFEVNRSLREFRIPAYQVEDADVSVIRDIFDRTNSYGKRLSRAEIFSGLTAPDEGAEFESDDPLATGVIAERIERDRGFGRIDDDTILYCILARRGQDISRDPRAEFEDSSGLLDFPGEGRADAYAAGAEALEKAVVFLQEDAGVPHFTFLPHRNFLVVLTRFFAHFPDPDPRERLLLRRWFWRTAVAGPHVFKGGAAVAARSLVGKIEPRALSASLQALLRTVDIEIRGYPNATRLRSGQGAGRIILCAWWSLRPRAWNPELTEFEVITEARLAQCLSGRPTASFALEPVLPNRSISAEQRTWAANRILLAPWEDENPGTPDDLLGVLPSAEHRESWFAALASHHFTLDMVRRYQNGDYGTLLNARQELIDRSLHEYLDRMCEWGFENTPSLDELILDDEPSEEDDALF